MRRPRANVLRALARKATPQQITLAKDALSGQTTTPQQAIPPTGIALIGLRGAGWALATPVARNPPPRIR